MSNDPRSYRTEPDAAFVDRLESDLLRRLADQSDPIGDDAMTLDLLEEGTDRGQRRRSWMAPVIAAAALIAVGAVVVVRAGDDPAPRASVTSSSLHDVAFELRWPDLAGLETTACVQTDVSYDSAQNTHCFRQFSGEATLAGDISGTALWLMVGNVGEAADAEDSTVLIPATFTATYVVEATVDGCGTGEFMIAEVLRFDGWASGAFSGTWRVVPGSGRGELSAISGGGEVPGDHVDSGTTQVTRTGQIACD